MISNAIDRSYRGYHGLTYSNKCLWYNDLSKL